MIIPLNKYICKSVNQLSVVVKVFIKKSDQKQPQGVSGVHVLIVSNKLNTLAKCAVTLFFGSRTRLAGRPPSLWILVGRDGGREVVVAAAAAAAGPALARVLRTLDGFVP